MAGPETQWEMPPVILAQASGSADEPSADEAPTETDEGAGDATASEAPTAEATDEAGASDDHGDDAAGGEASHDGAVEALEAVEGAPPEDHASEGFFQDTYTYTGLALLLLIVIVARPAWRAISGMLDARADRIRNELDEAQKLREEAQSALATFQRKQRDALAEAEGIISHAREESERIRQRSLEALEASLKRREQQAMDRIAQAEASAMAEVRSHAVDVAVAAAREIVGRQSDAASDAERIRAAIEELPSKLH